MDSLSSISPSIALPPANPIRRHHHYHRRRRISVIVHPNRTRRSSLSSFLTLPYSTCGKRSAEISCKSAARSAYGDEDEEREEVERALRLDGAIPGTSNEFVERVSSRAYDMRRNLQQTFDSSSYDVLETNPWRETSKPVYVLTHRENQLCTMKTRRNRSEVERELGMLFSKGGKWRSEIGKQAKQSMANTKFQMLVEDVREGVLVFEDESEAARYCDLLQGGGRGQGCEGVAEIEASSVFDLCQTMRALAVLFRRGRTPPLPESLKLNLRARKRSLEDQEDLK
ncbi:uncharacterized protein LOC130772349 [Actinidia eriantha]|uniref:uncharacterized protein LOC130772349 n=1 Tax=Actinidia eriantha TaxID=165200 RepID=UPI0025890C6A|nr:uncharacterized protein LOC130772349 [Actinidia eriantha]